MIADSTQNVKPMPIKSAKEKTDEAVRSIAKFQTGEIAPISTGFEWLDKHLLGGFLPSTIMTIGGLSNHGKTYLMQKIENSVIDNNVDVVLLRCNWESAVYKLLLRKITQKTDMKMSEVLFNTPHGDNLRRDGLYYYEEPVTARQFGDEVAEFLQYNLDKKVMITIDHVGLVKGREKGEIDALFEEMNKLKKNHPYVFFLPLMQLKRDLLDRVGNHPSEAPRQLDFYGSDQLFQLSDLVLAVYNPYKVGATGKYMVFSKFAYQYVDEQFIEEGGGKYNHFIPEGNYFYHMLKSRDIEDMEGFEDVWVEKLFDVRQPEEEEKNPQQVDDTLNDIL
jgi:archaellum biogenesis ATPase FlaH